MTGIHPTAIIEPGVELSPGVQVSPYVVIQGKVKIGAGTSIGPHTFIEGPCEIGEGNKIGAFVHLGGAPQHLQYRGEETCLIIGDQNVIREFVTIHRGTAQGIRETRIGNKNFIMVGCHIAHDCVLGNSIIMANYVQLAGHIRVDDNAVFGGLSAVHQHCRIGRGVMVAGLTGVDLDAPPYSVVGGDRARFIGLNRVGLQRMGMPEDKIQALKKAYRIIQSSGLLLKDALRKTEDEFGHILEVREVIEFFKTSERGVVRR